MAQAVNERETGTYTMTTADEAGVHPTMTAITLTLYDISTGTIINSRDHQNVLNANQVTYTQATGVLLWAWVTADQAIVTTRRSTIVEQHRAVFEFVWSTGRAWHSIEFAVTAEVAVVA